MEGRRLLEETDEERGVSEEEKRNLREEERERQEEERERDLEEEREEEDNHDDGEEAELLDPEPVEPFANARDMRGRPPPNVVLGCNPRRIHSLAISMGLIGTFGLLLLYVYLLGGSLRILFVLLFLGVILAVLGYKLKTKLSHPYGVSLVNGSFIVNYYRSHNNESFLMDDVDEISLTYKTVLSNICRVQVVFRVVGRSAQLPIEIGSILGEITEETVGNLPHLREIIENYNFYCPHSAIVLSDFLPDQEVRVEEELQHDVELQVLSDEQDHNSPLQEEGEVQEEGEGEGESEQIATIV